MKLITSLVVVVLVCIAAAARAQTFDAPQTPMKGAPRVIVTDSTGQETIGRLVSWTPGSIVIKSKGADRTYAAGEVVRVDLRDDSLRNGFLIGAVLGALPWIIGGCDCTGAQTAAMVAAIGVYGAVGAGIDALIPGRSPLWNSGAPAKSARRFNVTLSPRDRRASVGWRVW